MWIMDNSEYKQLKAIENLSDDYRDKLENDIMLYRSSIRQAVEFYEHNKNDISEKEADYLKELSLYIVWSSYNEIHNRLVWMSMQNTDKEEETRKNIFKYLKKWNEIEASNNKKYGEYKESELFTINDNFQLAKKRRKIGF
ncbi:hypothetical protein OIV57_17530 [Burkholderia pseudomallei]|uniref:hypothetical protein n=2 Tax=Burkholderia pseudomallei TaxID=28450 RepID=UPI0021F73ABE|nr:hypothetical protein [Burkholderia pseudomallei]MCV9913939.1 hypothetical protein [Burkholderia pseudomallei]